MSISITRDGRGFLLHTATRFPQRPASLFPFFGDARNLEAITPESLRFEILTPPPIEMRPGALIDYRLRIRGVPVRWRTEITDWDPPHRFVDAQVRGPYRWWRHEHVFEPDGEGTIMHDRVSYGVLGGAVVNALLVERDVRKIFEHRATVLRTRFVNRPSGTDPGSDPRTG